MQFCSITVSQQTPYIHFELTQCECQRLCDNIVGPPSTMLAQHWVDASRLLDMITNP